MRPSGKSLRRLPASTPIFGRVKNFQKGIKKNSFKICFKIRFSGIFFYLICDSISHQSESHTCTLHLTDELAWMNLRKNTHPPKIRGDCYNAQSPSLLMTFQVCVYIRFPLCRSCLACDSDERSDSLIVSSNF